MRILWVKVGGLWPLDTGGRLRSFHTLAELTRRHRVTLVTTHGPRDEPAGLKARLAGCERIISLPYAVPKQGTDRFARALLRSWLYPLTDDLCTWRITLSREAALWLLHGRPL